MGVADRIGEAVDPVGIGVRDICHGAIAIVGDAAETGGGDCDDGNSVPAVIAGEVDEDGGVLERLRGIGVCDRQRRRRWWW